MQRAWVIAALLAAACAAPGITPKVKAANSQYLYSIFEDKEPELALLDDEEKNGDTYNLFATEPTKFGILDHTFHEIMGSTALPPIEFEIDSTTTTDSSAVESITFDTNTIKQGIDDNETNAVTNPSIIGKNRNEKGSESYDFAETTPKSKRQRGDVTFATKNTVISQHKSDYDNSDPDTSTTKYDARPNNIPTLKTKNQNEGDNDNNIHSYWETRTLKNNSDKDNHNEGNSEYFTPYWKIIMAKNRKTKYSNKNYQNEGDEGNWDIFPSRNHENYNRFDYSRDDDRKYNYEPKIYRHNNKDKNRGRKPYSNSYDSYRSRSEYRGGRKHYGYKDSEECSCNSPDRKRYDDYHRHRDDNYKRRAHWPRRRYYNKERNSGRKYYKDNYHNDEYNNDEKHYGKFAKHNGWRHSKRHSR